MINEQASYSTAPVFVVGMNGSGTTMLLDCLGRHPALYDFPFETRFIPFLQSQLTGFQPLEDDRHFEALWRLVVSQPVIQRTLARSPQPLAMPEFGAKDRSLAMIVNSIFSQLAAARGKRRWCEKTPQHVQHLPLLSEMFPHAQFIHIIRDGRDCAASLHRRYGRRPEYTAYRWRHVVEAGRTEGRRLGAKYLEIRYEHLTTAPEPTMRKICSFLDEPFHPMMLTSRKPRNPHAGRHGETKGGIERNIERWRSYFDDGQVKRMEMIAGAHLAHLGYSVRFCEGNGTPSPLVVASWKWCGYGREFLQLIGSRVKGNRELTFSRISETIRRARMQARVNRF